MRCVSHAAWLVRSKQPACAVRSACCLLRTSVTAAASRCLPFFFWSGRTAISYCRATLEWRSLMRPSRSSTFS